MCFNMRSKSYTQTLCDVQHGVAVFPDLRYVKNSSRFGNLLDIHIGIIAVVVRHLACLTALKNRCLLVE